MDIESLAKEILRESIKQHRNNPNGLIHPGEFIEKFSHTTKGELVMAFGFLEDNFYIKELGYDEFQKTPSYFQISGQGITFASQTAAVAPPSITQTIHIAGHNYGAAGHNERITINNAINDFDDFTRLIQQYTVDGSVERTEIEELKNILQSHIEQGKPLERTFLARFSESVQKHAWIAAPVATLLLKRLIP